MLASTTIIITNKQIYQLAPDYFRLHPEVLCTICKQHMTFNDFAVHQPTATTTMIDNSDLPTIHSIIKNCTFIDGSNSTATYCKYVIVHI